MKKNFQIALLMTILTMLLLGVIYPFAVTALAQLLFPSQAEGSLITVGGKIVGSRLIGQSFTSPAYFHSRPSAAGPSGYDAADSGGSNLGPTNRVLIERTQSKIRQLHAENPNMPVPMDLVTTSASGLDPDISPAAAAFQIPRVARERGMTEDQVRALILKHTEGRQLGFLGESRVNVLELNLALDATHPQR